MNIILFGNLGGIGLLSFICSQMLDFKEDYTFPQPNTCYFENSNHCYPVKTQFCVVNKNKNSPNEKIKREKLGLNMTEKWHNQNGQSPALSL